MNILESLNAGFYYEPEFRLFKKRDKKVIFNNLNLGLKAGEKLWLRGKNGSGKSTLFSLFVRLLKLKSGEIFYEGKNYNERALKDLRKNIQLVQQNQKIALNPYKSVKYQIQIVFKNFDLNYDQNMVDKLIEGLNLDINMYQKCDTLSGGEASRLGLLRALIVKPKILLLDEINASLDEDNLERVIDLLKDINKRGGTSIIFASHNEIIASKLCNSVFSLD